MSKERFSVDVAALANSASSYYRDIVATSTQDGPINEFDMVKATKYTMKRLRATQLITPEEEQQLGQIIDGVNAREDVSEIIEAIQKKDHPSPLAVALAELAAGSSEDVAATKMYGAIMGALISHHITSAQISGIDTNTGSAAKAMASVLGAVGGAAAASASAIIQTRYQLTHKKAHGQTHR